MTPFSKRGRYVGRSVSRNHEDAVRPLGKSVRSGAVWSAASVVLFRLANIALMAVVARLVAPAEFGTFAAALTVHAMVASMAELGAGAAVARADLNPDDIAPTVATVAIAASLLLAIVMVIWSPQLASSMGAPNAADPLRVLAITVALIGPFAVPGAQLQRTFRQRRIFIANAVAFVPSGVTLVLLAAQGDGAMAFAWSRVVGQVCAGIVIAASVPKRYKPGWNRAELRPLMRFALPLAFANVLSQLVYNVDYVFVGRLTGVESLGLYTLAFNICSWPVAALSAALNGVVLPAFSRVRHEGGDLGGKLCEATRTVALIAFPVSVLTAVLADPLIRVVYGERWLGAVPVLQVLSLYGAVFALCLLYANTMIAMGRSVPVMIVQVAALAALLPSIWAGIEWLGLVGVAWAHIAVVLTVTLPVYIIALRAATRVRIRPLLLGIAPPLVAGLAAGVAAVLVQTSVQIPVVRLALGGIVGGGTYLLLVAPFCVPTFSSVLGTRAGVGHLVESVGRGWERVGIKALPHRGRQS